ncbi:hypothetical protein BTJ40_12920 [Microbulbifer sp. A4B17]|uniref:hypothetical protein n=1 Tax=Microbulbifer sp. A4B17 TaxID=359370 RepID=UPI000D52BC0C|nr:hypothetical protein [Microbulbifer sp. A4B17]AWF81655.1 hypothetical protein BTJ40_12920 [Microbulbifer sp. A4B17]
MTDQAIILARRKAAVKALSFFKYKAVQSANNPFAFMFDPTGKKHASDVIALCRSNHQPHNANDIAQALEDSARTGFGNCNEKAAICYSSLKSDPYLTDGNHHVTMVGAVGYDHAYCVVSDNPLTPNMSIRSLGRLAMIVDGWTEDWYFPNLDFISRTYGSAITFPNPRQTYIRVKTRDHQLTPAVTIDTPNRKLRKTNNRF